MMNDILKQINAGEVSGVQFKERILDKYDIACELVAFSNSHGGKLEIPYTSLVEFTVNSLVHRSLNMKAPVRIFIFDNRVEIHSPGALPNGLTIDDIKAGTSMPRNMFLFNISVLFLEPPKRYLTELESACIPRTVSVTSPPLLQQDICR